MRKEYALLAYFDSETEQQLKNFWYELNELGITSYGMAVKDRRPHITLADYQEVDIEVLATQLDSYFQHQHQVPIKLNILGSFIGLKMLYLAPTITKELLDFHGNYHENFKRFNQNEKSYYLPGIWSPHCTIAGGLTDETLLQTFEYCKKNIPYIYTKIAEIGLIEVFFDEEGNIVNDRCILSKHLNS